MQTYFHIIHSLVEHSLIKLPLVWIWMLKNSVRSRQMVVRRLHDSCELLAKDYLVGWVQRKKATFEGSF